MKASFEVSQRIFRVKSCHELQSISIILLKSHSQPPFVCTKPWFILQNIYQPQLMACPPDVPINRLGNHTKRTAKKPKGVVVHSAKRCTKGEVTVLLTSLSGPD